MGTDDFRAMENQYENGEGTNGEEAREERVLRLIYSSQAAAKLTPEQLLEILDQARQSNERLGVSGMLLHADQTFLQVLEGDEEVVESLYAKIEEDDRHVDMRVLLREVDAERCFGDWTMGFVRADRDMIRQIAGLNDYLQSSVHRAGDADEETARAQKVLEQFKSGRWRREIDG